MNLLIDHRLLSHGPIGLALVLGAAATALFAPASPSPETTAVAVAPDLVVRTATAAARSPWAKREIPFKRALIYWEYNSSANDLGVHVTLDAEDWKSLRIENPCERTLFEVRGRGSYQSLGMTELFFEGAEPSLNEFPLRRLLELFPEGEYTFEGRTVDNEELESTSRFSHAIPAGPSASATLHGNSLRIHWTEVTSPPRGFPNRPIVIAGYQVIVESFQVTLPPTARSVTVPPELVAVLEPGEHQFEVLAIEQSGNQTITEGTFVR
jgi:hypothetical protein